MVDRGRNPERAERTRTALLDAARRLFAEDGYAATSTPDVAVAAGLTRGALYHHFRDKQDLFRGVVEREQTAVAAAIEVASGDRDDPVDAVRAGGEAFLDAMADEGRRRILLIDGPAVLGVEEMRALEARHAARTLVVGVQHAIDAGAMRPLPAEALADLLDAAFDRVTMADDASGAHRTALWGLLEGLRTRP